MRHLTATFAALAMASVAAAGPASAATEEDQIRAVLDGMNTSYNRADFVSFASHVCSGMKKADGFEEGWRASRQTDGPTDITVYSVSVTGTPPSRAVADVKFAAANRSDAKVMEVDFVREGAQWKACAYAQGRSV